MFRHSIKLFFRNIKKQKSTFVINIVGLSTGLACVLMIALWITDEISMDKFHEEGDQPYQVMRNRNDNTANIMTKESQSNLLAPTLAAEFPEIKHIVPVNFSDDFNSILSTDEKSLKAKGITAGKDFFKVFSFPLIQGNKDRVLQGTNNVVISDIMAVKLYGETNNIIGRTINLDHDKYNGPYNISGVFKKSGYRSSEDFDFLLTNELFLSSVDSESDNWISNRVQVFLTLKENVNVNLFNSKIKGLVRSKMQLDYEPKGQDWIGTLFLRRYSSKYLYGHYENGIQSGGRINYVILFSIIGLIIMTIACINFMNLSTAKALGRTKEIGLKKVVGANRRTLIFQYLRESTYMALLSLPVALFIVSLCLPQFNEITNKDFTLDFGIGFILLVLGITLFTGIVSGSYPALYLSNFKPAVTLKGKLDTSFGEIWARKGLVIFQFILTIIFIVSVLVIYQQMDFLQSKYLGYDKDNIISFEKEGKGMIERMDTFLSEIKNVPGVVNASDYTTDMVGGYGGTWGVDWEGKGTNESIDFAILGGGYDFIKTLGIEIVDGRTFSREFNTDSTNIIFNETAIKSMGLTDPIGKTIRVFGGERKIVGVTKDFHFEGLHENVKPCFIMISPENSKVMVKLRAGTERETLSRLEDFYKEYNQGVPFEFTFLDDNYQDIYTSEQLVATLSEYFTIIAIIISCLGLFGLSLHTAERRGKEISIRKVLGQTAAQVTIMLSGEFAKLILISTLISLPIAYLVTNNWLSNFAYHIPLKIWHFLGAGGMALLVAMLTVGSQAIRAANRNPVDCLKDE
ncbi:ABC transporter permease [Flagellimonas algicola]|uniref:FtsX-like permease family protein n=1 Tax=Flagellimonas algicola TaxID=2583815 RepID=A0ABY2WIZ5_9FLAO|nr:ABC transporter permease [Allomuricauda algicola]TMU54575.1 FtsX-like permease family protein [Allomuricauda algicola]